MSDQPISEAAKSDFTRLISQSRLTNAEVARVAKVLAARMTALNQNQMKLHDSNVTLAKRLDRLEDLTLDHTNPDGSVRHGVSASLRATQKHLIGTENRISTLMLEAQIQRSMIRWVILMAREQPDVAITDDMITEAEERIRSQFIEEADKAIEFTGRIKEVTASMKKCAGCAHWSKEALVVAAGVDGRARCTRQAVQVDCPECRSLYGLPVDPNNITGECPKCKAKLVREISSTTEDGTERRLTMCRAYRVDPEELRSEMEKEGIPRKLIDEIIPAGAAQ